MLNIEITPQREALLKGFNNEFHALLRVNAENIPNLHERQNTLNLAIVIDRSGSMSGQPLDEAKRSAIMMVEQMHSSDRVAIVTYDNTAELVVPSTLCSERQSIIECIRNIQSGGVTALHAGWLMGAEEVARHKTPTSLNRVLLLSDGNANRGLVDQLEIKSQCAQLADAGVTTSTYGLGHDFNEQLMVEMSTSGLGQGYYGETAEDLADPFKEEFELLLNTVASKLILSAEAPDFVGLRLLNKLRQSQNGWSMPDIAAGGEGWALFKISIKKNEISDAPMEVLRCVVSYTDQDGVSQKTSQAKLILQPLSPNAFEAVEENERVGDRISELEVASFQEEAREAAQRGDWDRVDRVVARAKVAAKDNVWMKQSLEALEKYSRKRQTQQFCKEALYSADKMKKRLVADDESSIAYSQSIEAGKAAYLRRKMERGKRM